MASTNQLPVESTLFPQAFCDQIQKCNSQKSAETPIVLVLQTCHDPRLAFFSDSEKFNLLDLATTHKIAMVALNSGDIRTSIQKFKKEYNCPKAILFMGHGNADCIRFGKENEPSSFYTVKDVRQADYDSLEDDVSILFQSCWTGRRLAPTVAAVHKGFVYAPLCKNSQRNTFYYSCKDHGLELVCLDQDGNHQAKRFSQTSPPSSPCVDADWIKSKQTERIAFLREQFRESNNLGILNKLGSLYLSLKSYDLATECFQESADKGNLKAQYYLGFCYETRGLLKEAFQQYEKFAENLAICRRFGHCYLYGIGVTQAKKKLKNSLREQRRRKSPCYALFGNSLRETAPI